MRSQNGKSNNNELKKSNRRGKRRRGRKKQPTNRTAFEANECFRPEACNGKHVSMTDDPVLLENDEKFLRKQQIRIIETEEECKRVVRELLSHCEEYNVLGFICKYSPNVFQGPVALLQLASHRGLCALFRLCHLKVIPNDLQELLENENIIKVGIKPIKNGAKLIKEFGISRIFSTIDFRVLSEKCGTRCRSIGKLCEEYLKVPLIHNTCIFTSNWSVKFLKKVQLDYAAKEVHVLIELFKTFAAQIKPKPIDVNNCLYIRDFIKENCADHLIAVTEQSMNEELKLDLKPQPKPKPTPKFLLNQTINFIETFEGCEAVMEVVKAHCEEYNVLGLKFFKKRSNGERLMQLATFHGLFAIIDLNQIEQIPSQLKEILADKSILKVGIHSIRYKERKFTVRGVLDLNVLLKHYRKESPYFGMKTLCRITLKLRIEESSEGMDKTEEDYLRNHAKFAIEVFKKFMELLEYEKDENDPKKNLSNFIRTCCKKVPLCKDDFYNKKKQLESILPLIQNFLFRD